MQGHGQPSLGALAIPTALAAIDVLLGALTLALRNRPIIVTTILLVAAGTVLDAILIASPLDRLGHHQQRH